MSYQDETRGLWLRTRYREGQYEGEACLLVYDVDPFDDSQVGGDVKQVFEKRAGTANIFIVAPFLSNDACREALKTGVAAQRAMSYMSSKNGNMYLIEMQVVSGKPEVSLTTTMLTWDATKEEVQFAAPEPLDLALRDGWLFDLFDSNEGLVVAPPGVHFRKSSRKHTDKFLRAANTLTSSSACGLIAMFALQDLALRQPKRILVDTAPLLSLAYAMMRAAKARDIWESDVPARSFSSYGGQEKMGRLSHSDVMLVSASTSGSLVKELERQGAKPESTVTLFFLGTKSATRPAHVLCDLTIAADRGFGYQPVENFSSHQCKLCDSEFILAELEGDQFLLQQRQHRALKFVQTTQSEDALKVLTELYESKAVEVVLRPDATEPSSIEVDEKQLLQCAGIRTDFIRLLRRYVPQPLGLIVLVNLSEDEFKRLVGEAILKLQIPDTVKVIDRTQVASQPALAEGEGVLVVFGCLSSPTVARQINASLRSIVKSGNVAYLSALTLAATPEQYQDLKTFLGYGERGSDTFTYRDARRLALPGSSAGTNAWAEELDLLNELSVQNEPTLNARREILSTQVTARESIFLPGSTGDLAIKPDFVFMDTRGRADSITQADVFAIVSNLFAAARSRERDLTKKATPNEVVELSKSVYGHVLLAPAMFETFNDAVLKASFLRAARRSELMYEVDADQSTRMAQIVLAELEGWSAGTGEALSEMLLALATKRLRLRDGDRAKIRARALAANLPAHLAVLTGAIQE